MGRRGGMPPRRGAAGRAGRVKNCVDTFFTILLEFRAGGASAAGISRRGSFAWVLQRSRVWHEDSGLELIRTKGMRSKRRLVMRTESPVKRSAVQ